MTTIARRTFRASPHRTASDTWTTIVELLTQGGRTGAREELLAVCGIASSVITDQAPKQSPIVVTCEGPRTRIYCLYDEEALESADADEAPLGFDPLQGEWSVSLPCLAEDLDWVRGALQKHSRRITARDVAMGFDIEETPDASKDTPLVLDVKGFLGS
ncbi:hypothetical protein [Archangium violaceum]|uniref:hypothetical protein n=1 Tax=Archangium violaceum TaxID=83451 RepID=UPI0036DB3ECC